MDTEALTPILAGIARHGLTAAGGYLVSSGVIQSSEVQGFVGADMVLAGIAWSWWQKRGQAQVAEMLKRVTATKTTAAAVDVAKTAPNGAAVK